MRSLKKCMDQLCRSAAMALADDGGAKQAFTPESLPEYMDMNPIHHKRVPGIARRGTVEIRLETSCLTGPDLCTMIVNRHMSIR